MLFTDDTIFAGTTWYKLQTFSDYSAETYDCQLLLKKSASSSNTYSFNLTASGSSFLLSEVPADTALDGAGKYAYQWKFTHKTTGAVYVPYEGFVEVKAILSGSSDLRSEDEKVLEKLYAARLTIADRDYVEINIGGKSAKFKTLNEIEAKIDEIETKLGIRKSRRLLFSFGTD